MNLNLLGGKPRMRLLAKAGSVDGLAFVGKRLRKNNFANSSRTCKRGSITLLASMLFGNNVNVTK